MLLDGSFISSNNIYSLSLKEAEQERLNSPIGQQSRGTFELRCADLWLRVGCQAIGWLQGSLWSLGKARRVSESLGKPLEALGRERSCVSINPTVRILWINRMSRFKWQQFSQSVCFALLSYGSYGESSLFLILFLASLVCHPFGFIHGQQTDSVCC